MICRGQHHCLPILIGGGVEQAFVYNHVLRVPENAESIPNLHLNRISVTSHLNPVQPSYRLLSDLIAQNGHGDRKDLILKLDLDGKEYNVLHTVSHETLMQFSQIVIVFRGLLQSRLENLICFALDKLNSTHQLVHVHGDNSSSVEMRGGKVLPNVLECTYLRRDLGEFIKSKRFFPTLLDAPNDPTKPDLNLGYWG